MHLVCGFLGEIDPADHIETFEDIAVSTCATVQAFDARYIVSRNHVERAVELADRAIDRHDAVADDRSVEILLYAAGRRQINRAFELGLKEGDHPVVVLIDGGDEVTAKDEVETVFQRIVPCDDVIGPSDHVISYFDISKMERETGAAIEDLVIERIALLAINH